MIELWNLTMTMIKAIQKFFWDTIILLRGGNQDGIPLILSDKEEEELETFLRKAEIDLDKLSATRYNASIMRNGHNAQ